MATLFLSRVPEDVETEIGDIAGVDDLTTSESLLTIAEVTPGGRAVFEPTETSVVEVIEPSAETHSPPRVINPDLQTHPVRSALITMLYSVEHVLQPLPPSR